MVALNLSHAFRVEIIVLPHLRSGITEPFHNEIRPKLARSETVGTAISILSWGTFSRILGLYSVNEDSLLFIVYNVQCPRVPQVVLVLVTCPWDYLCSLLSMCSFAQ